MANYIPKSELLQKAEAELNGVSDSFDVSVKGDNIIVTSKWLNGTAVGAGGVESMRETATAIYTIKDNGKYKWHDVLDSEHTSIGVNGISLSKSKFAGKSVSFNKTVYFGKNKNNPDGGLGVQTAESNTAKTHKIMKEWLEKYGYKKTLF